VNFYSSITASRATEQLIGQREQVSRRSKFSLGRGDVWAFMSALMSCEDKALTLYRMVMPIGTSFLKEKINN